MNTTQRSILHGLLLVTLLAAMFSTPAKSFASSSSYSVDKSNGTISNPPPPPPPPPPPRRPPAVIAVRG